MPTSLSSAGGILALLEEPLPELKVFALQKLEGIVDEFWAEISESIGRIEILHEESDFPERPLAALIASKVYYHLGSYEDSLQYALGAGSLFDVHSRSMYVETTIAKIIDSYIQKRDAGESVPPAQEGIVNRMFERCFEDGEVKQALGIAIEARRLDVFQRAIKESNDENGMLSYAFRVAMTLIQNRTYRATLLRVLIDLYRGLEKPDYVQMCQCLIFLNDPHAVAGVLETLSKGSSADVLMAYQIAFDMYESATQQFLNAVVQAVRGTSTSSSSSKVAKEEESEKKDTKEEDEKKKEEEGEDAKMEEEGGGEVDEETSRTDKLISILSGSKTIYLHLQFLIRNDHSDLLILKQTKDAVRVSICHTATVIANGLMHCGTTHDSFLRDNLDWLSRATNWAKLSATASLGVIHRGHERDSLSLMQSYLPKDSANSSGYAEGGGLYALGLIHANHGGEIMEYLLNQLKESGFEQLRHGGCLGLGLAAMGTHRADVYEQLKFNLFQDDAVVGEAAGLAMGLVQLGSKDATAIEDMVSYAHETQHEKILRGLAVGISLVMYGLLEEADPLIDSLCSDKDAILRRSGMYTIAMAYCGTGSNKAIRKLLHVAVSDVNDDVRRAAVMGLGFILFKTPDHCPGVVSLLSESYNPHVRYGAAMALGIACAGTGSKEAIALLEPMTNDPVNYVRQGALIASALILIQHTEATCPKVKDFRALYAKVIGDKHEDVMAKFGAILAQGIIDGGGRNVTVSLQSRTGHTNMVAVVGMLVFTQYWYWFPLSHFLGLAFTPSCLIGLNENLDMPVVSFKSNAKPSVYGYPPMLEEKKKEDKEKVATAVLSITHKQKRKDAEKRKKDAEKMEVDEKEATPAVVAPEKTEKTDKKTEEKRKDEPSFEVLSNPARVMKPQLKVTQIEDPHKYKALKDTSIGGIIMMCNQTGEKDEIVEPVQIKKNHVDSAIDGDEPEPPEPFEYIED
eukprot:TRINITY_DN3477_c0_g1_i4.p1 TRINITY_DN3477_c0_g1~~TRINITY_DN3477_c0_g1_i4.p1  ORF type:complete len:967 (+),score=385.28 TRINITY_DN3477_c0_g1_i4:94-2994(+)